MDEDDVLGKRGTGRGDQGNIPCQRAEAMEILDTSDLTAAC